MIEEECWVTYSEICATLDNGMTAIRTVFHTHLSVKEVYCRIQHRLTEDQKKADRRVLEYLERYHENSSKIRLLYYYR